MARQAIGIEDLLPMTRQPVHAGMKDDGMTNPPKRFTLCAVAVANVEGARDGRAMCRSYGYSSVVGGVLIVGNKEPNPMDSRSTIIYLPHRPPADLQVAMSEVIAKSAERSVRRPYHVSQARQRDERRHDPS